jgi:hypothetical protein
LSPQRSRSTSQVKARIPERLLRPFCQLGNSAARSVKTIFVPGDVTEGLHAGRHTQGS